MLANREMEQINSEALKALQFERLHKTLEWAYSKSSFYRNKFDESECAPQQFESLTDIEKFPFTLSKELQQVSAMDLLTLPLSGVARISLWEHPQPTVHMYTINDIAANVEMTSRVLTAAGISRASIVGLLGDMADSGLFDAQQALEAIGAAAVPLSTDYERTLSSQYTHGFGVDRTYAFLMLNDSAQDEAATEEDHFGTNMYGTQYAVIYQMDKMQMRVVIENDRETQMFDYDLS